MPMPDGSATATKTSSPAASSVGSHASTPVRLTCAAPDSRPSTVTGTAYDGARGGTTASVGASCAWSCRYDGRRYDGESAPYAAAAVAATSTAIAAIERCPDLSRTAHPLTRRESSRRGRVRPPVLV